MRTPNEVLESIDSVGLYTVEHAAKLLREMDPSLSHEEALREVRMAIASGDLPLWEPK